MRNPQAPNKRKAAGGNQTASQNKQANPIGNSANAQRQRLVAALKHRPMSTIEIRRELDILGVAPRVFELRSKGFEILTHWRQEPTECGKLHRVALYVLVKEAHAV